MKKKFVVKLLSLAALLLSSCSIVDFFFGADIEGITITNKKDVLFVDEEYQLSVDISPSNAKNKDLVYKSRYNEIASVDENGLIKGLKEGETDIEVYSKVNYSITDKFSVKVIEPELQSISVKTEPKVNYVEGQTFDPSLLVLEGTYEGKVTRSIEYNTHKDDFSFVPSLTTPLSISDQSVRVNYKEFSTVIDITVSEPQALNKTELQYTYDDYMANNLYDNMDNCPLEGNPKLLIIPIWFNDSDTFIDTSKKESVRQDIQKAYIGSTSDTGWHSVKSYYEAESFGKITLSATITDWYDLNDSYLTYAPENNIGYTQSLVTTASNAYFTDHPSDSRKNYDSNNDGYLDGVMLIYAAPDYDSLGEDNTEHRNLWAYCYYTGNSKNISNPKANVFFWASYDFLYGRNAYERTGKTSYARGYTEHGVSIDTHCLIHEMGHVFGLQDYYDYSGQYSPAGGFCMQDYNVGGHDPYSVMAYGWADPYIPTESMTISIGDFQSTHDMILLANHDVTVSPFDEYILLEFYSPSGLNELDSMYCYRDAYPQGPSVGGIRLWHVDARLFKNSPLTRNITTIPDDSVYHMMSNSYNNRSGSPFGQKYYDYNTLQLIRNDTTATYRPIDYLSSANLFKTGESFDMSTFSSQFVKGTKMNDGNSLGWSFRVDSITSTKATITLIKA